MNSIVDIADLRVSFRQGKRRQQALDGVSFRIQRGETVGFIGPNGAGKTTTLHVLLGFLAPDSGRATMLGEDTSTAASRARIGYLSEHPEAYKFMTGREYLRMTGKLFGLKKTDRNARADELLATVELAEHGDKRIGTYSRGMLQRVGIAQALMNDPELLILDEPTNGLDPIGRMKIRGLIASLKAKGTTIFFSSHELSEVETICDQIIMIADGRVIQQGTLAELVDDGRNLESYFLDALQTTEAGDRS